MWRLRLSKSRIPKAIVTEPAEGWTIAVALWSPGEARLWMVADRWGQHMLLGQEPRGQSLFLHWNLVPPDF